MIFTTNFPMNEVTTSIFPWGENPQQQHAIDRRFACSSCHIPIQHLGCEM
jgi:cytochrome c551/c552